MWNAIKFYMILNCLHKTTAKVIGYIKHDSTAAVSKGDNIFNIFFSVALLLKDKSFKKTRRQNLDFVISTFNLEQDIPTHKSYTIDARWNIKNVFFSDSSNFFMVTVCCNIHIVLLIIILSAHQLLRFHIYSFF